MEQFLTTEVTGVLFGLGSALAVLGFLFISRVLRKLGNVQMIIGLSIVEIIALILMGAAFSPALTITAFVVFMTINPLIYLGIDIFSETLIGNNESATGSKRGLILTLMSLMSVLAAFTVGLIVGDNNARLSYTYYYSAGIFSLFLMLIIIHFKHFVDPKYHELRILHALRGYWLHRDMRYVLLSQFILQVFFSWTTLYIPLYMATVIGLGWDTIAPIIAIGLLAYVLLEWPVGFIADKYIGEKEMMAAGFLILAVSVSWLAFLDTESFIAWALLMFITRSGAALVESTCESYFFKHTKGTDANIMSFFRLTRPLGFLFGALLGSAALLFMPFNLTFVVLGFVMVAGIFFTTALKDTR